MVVMEYLDPDQGWESLDGYFGRMPDAVFDTVQKAMKTAHDVGFAHGDMRSRNIFVRYQSLSGS